MKKLSAYILLGGLLAGLNACDKDSEFSESDSDVRVYLSQAVNGPYANISVNRRAPLQSDSIFKFDVNAFFAGGGYKSAPGNVPVTFAIDYSTWDSINAVRAAASLPAFEKVPAHVFSFNTTTAVIKSGTTVSENIAFGIDGKKVEEGHNYMVPVRLQSAGNYPLNRTLSITYFVVAVTPPVYAEINRSAWTIFNVDSEEASGEGPNNGRAIFALDGLLNTFWHTQWDGGEPPLPHHIAVDMKQSNTLSGLYLTARQNAPNGAPKTVNVDVSADGTTWQSAGTYQLLAVNAKQPVFFAQTYTARYFRVTVTATHGNTNITFFAEISAF